MWGNDSGDRRPPTSSDSGYDDRAQDPVSGYGRGAALRQGERKSRGEEDSAGWTADEDEKLSKSVRENGLDDWTLGDWSEVAAAVGGGKTPEQCFNRWHAEYSRQAALGSQEREGYADAAGNTYSSSAASQHLQYQPQYHQYQQHQQGPPWHAHPRDVSGGYPPAPVLPRPRQGADGQTTSGPGQPAFRLRPPASGDPLWNYPPVGGGAAPPGYAAGQGSNPAYPGQPSNRPYAREPDVNLSMLQGPQSSWRHPGGVSRSGFLGAGAAAAGVGRGRGEHALHSLARLASLEAQGRSEESSGEKKQGRR